MVQPDTTAAVAQADVLNALLGIDGGMPLAALRAQRPEATGHTQGSYQALFVGPFATPVSSAERFATALRVVALHAEPVLVAHYTAHLRAAGASENLVAGALA